MKKLDLNLDPTPPIAIADLPPSGPYVSFETSIGESLKPDEMVDFDESALYKTSGTIGLSSETLAKTAVTFCGKKSTAILKSDDDGSVRCGDGGFNFVKCRLNKDRYMGTLRHELEHIKDSEDKLYKTDSSWRRYRIGKLGFCVVCRVWPIACISSALNFITYSEMADQLHISEYGSQIVEISAQIGIAACWMLLLTGSAANLWGYTFHPAERSARRAEKLKTPDVVHISRFDGREKVPLLGRAL